MTKWRPVTVVTAVALACIGVAMLAVFASIWNQDSTTRNTTDAAHFASDAAREVSGAYRMVLWGLMQWQ